MIKTIDAHVGGQVLRLIVDGFPTPRGATMWERRAWALRHADRQRRQVMLEPRGHHDLCGAVLTEPVAPGSHAGVLFFSNDGYPLMSAHGVIALVTIALERQLLVLSDDVGAVTLDTPAGTVRAAVRRFAPVTAAASRVDAVTLTAVPAFVVQPGVEVVACGRRVRVDIAFGGNFYAIVDAESAGLAIDVAHAPELRRFGADLVRSLNQTLRVVHPLESRWTGVDAAVITGPSRSGLADLQTVTVSESGAIDRSGGGTGMSAVMAVLSAMGLLDEATPFTQESLTGVTLVGRITGRTQVGEQPAIVPTIEGRAWIIGEHIFHASDDDGLGDGFVMW